MSQDRRRWRPSTSSHWEPAYGHNASYDSYTPRPYTPYHSSTAYAGRSFNYWRDDSLTSNYPPRQHSGQTYRPDSYDQRWRDDSRSWHGESSYSRGWRDSGPRRERGSWRERSPPRSQPPSRQRYSTYTTPTPSLIPPSSRAKSPPRESTTATSRQQQSSTLPERRASSPSPPPLKPSSAYLTLTQSPSQVLQDPTSVRKLLVLDLNGTLLIRSPRSGARSRVSTGHKLRAVQPRPYMGSFREYLFYPKTKEWLDVMVWSSAQPHSVDDMVDKVFGSSKAELKAVWNRKSLGLSEEQYHRKSVTTKDLTKPWKLLPLGLSPEEYEGGSLPSSQSQIAHSASTTLLLDDSSHKAVLQPYNHVCIPEYDSARRHHDLQSLQAAREPKEGTRTKKDKSQEGAEEDVGHRDAPSGSTPEREPFDVTLLAVIGILESVKLQSNVAGWIRRGGLWAGLRMSNVEHGGVGMDKDKSLDGKTSQSEVVQTGNDDSSTSDPAVTPGEAHIAATMWFSDLANTVDWVSRGRETLERLGIDISHGVTG